MPIHRWSQVDAGILHAFHHDWITEISRALNRGLLPADYYALPEQIAGSRGPDVLTLQHSVNGASLIGEPTGGVALATVPPQVQMRLRSEHDQYAAKAKAVVIRHISNHRVIAIVEIVSPGNKSSRQGLRAFTDKAVEMLRANVHLLLIDLFPPGQRDPRGIHGVIWNEFCENEFVLHPDQPLTLAAYIGGDWPEAFIEPTAPGSALIDMPLFLTSEVYVPVPLEATYRAAFEGLPSFWRNVLNSTLAT